MGQTNVQITGIRAARPCNAARVLASINSDFNTLEVVAEGSATTLASAQGAYSYYDPSTLFTGYSWDCLSIAPLLSKRVIRRILLLGLGGGTVVRQCRLLFPQASIDAVEIDEDVIKLADKYFHLPTENLSIKHADARAFLRQNSAPYDAVLENLWLSRRVRREIPCGNAGYLDNVRQSLEPGGIYAHVLLDRSTDSEVQDAVEMLGASFSEIALLRPSIGKTSVLVTGTEMVEWETVLKHVRRYEESSIQALQRIQHQAPPWR